MHNNINKILAKSRVWRKKQTDFESLYLAEVDSIHDDANRQRGASVGSI